MVCFFEVHPDPDRALCDGPNSLALDGLPDLLATLKRIDAVVRDAKEGINDRGKGRGNGGSCN